MGKTAESGRSFCSRRTASNIFSCVIGEFSAAYEYCDAGNHPIILDSHSHLMKNFQGLILALNNIVHLCICTEPLYQDRVFTMISYIKLPTLLLHTHLTYQEFHDFIALYYCIIHCILLYYCMFYSIVLWYTYRPRY